MYRGLRSNENVVLKKEHRESGEAANIDQPSTKILWMKKKEQRYFRGVHTHFPTWRPAWYDDDVNVDGMRVGTV